MIWIILTLLLSSCTLSMTFINSDGTATDMLDETQSPTNDVKPDLHIKEI